MKAPPVIVADFETHGIEARPKYPPKPVSLALKWPDRKDYQLMSWGHEGGDNNCTEKQARGAYLEARNSKYAMLFQNGSFDQDVAESHWDIPLLPWDKTHETMYLLFLWDPHAPSLALKESAHRILNIKPEEQDLLKEWILANVPEAKKKPSTWGAYIYKAPYRIVRPYHKGDLVRTSKLFDWLLPRVVDAGMLEAYQRELKLMPILLRNARRGMRVDLDRLEQDLPLMKAGVEKIDGWLRKRLGDINLDSDRQLGEALFDKGIVTDFRRTPKGQLSVSKKYLTLDKFADKQVYQALTYRGQMSTSISMFVEPWIELASGTENKVLHPNWIQVRSNKMGGDSQGARSNRIICTRPNLLNIPKKWRRAITAGYIHPTFVKVPELPFMRTYVLPAKKKQWGRRDYNQQEVRLFAHFEEGPIMQGFLDDPRFDIHEGVRAETERMLVEAGLRDAFERDDAKTGVFGAFYGQGLNGLMEALKLREEDKPVGQMIHKGLHRAVPSIRELSNQLKALSQNGEPIRTWGGRLYYVEPPMYVEKFGRNMTFEYKLISYLIQGSGADVIKEALVRYDAHPKRSEDLTVTVYDEINIDLPLNPKGAKQEMTVLRDCMQSVEVDIPMLSDGEVGPSWGKLEKYAV
jgi:DNA polymerase I-like protein with 3'-5' exonuclease and polymerase domains